MIPKIEVEIGPVPLEIHYGVFKDVEERIKEHLDELEHEYFIAGLRVAYDLVDSPNEPDDLPFAVDFGYLGPLEDAINCSEPGVVSEEELLADTRNSPIPIALLDELFDYAKARLEEAANAELNIGVFVTLTGSPTLGYSVNCPCKRRGRRRRKYCYYHRKTKRIRCRCTNREC